MTLCIRRARAIVALFLGALVCCAMLASCKAARPPGELVVVVTTDLSVPKDVDTLHVNVLAGGTILLNHDYGLGPTKLNLPATIGVVAGPNTTAPVTIQISGLLNGVVRVSRDAIVAVPTNRVAMWPMPLDWLCIGHSCLQGETCQAGACVSATPPADPQDYLPESANDGGADAAAAPCFDTSACFTSVRRWPAPRADCTVPKPMGEAGVNVALVVVGDGICSLGRCLIPLDAESAEGWQTSKDGTRIELPLAVCANDAIKAVEVSTTCPTKRANAALCPGGSVLSADGGCVAGADGGCPAGYVCQAEAGQAQCVLSGGANPPVAPHCQLAPDLVCPGGATAYACHGTPDSWLQCNPVHHRQCDTFGWCCVPRGYAGPCVLDAGAPGVLVDDMSQTTVCGGQNKLRTDPGVGSAGYWYTVDDRGDSGSMVPTPGDGFNYMPVTSTCAAPFSSASCMKSVTPYRGIFPNGWATMGFDFVTSGNNPDGGTSTPVAYPVTAYKGIRFWATAVAGAQSVSIQFPDVRNDMAAPGAECGYHAPLLCGNFFQTTRTFDAAWRPYEVSFDELKQALTPAQGFYTMGAFDPTAALGIQFVVSSDGGTPLAFDLCVAEIYLVPN